MAGDWIARCKGLSKKHEVLLVARITGLSRRETADILMEFWEWADGETADGVLDGLTILDICDVIEGTNEKFWLAVVQAGWLKITGKGIEIPNFSRWLGKSAKQRLQKNTRQARWRSPGEKKGNVDSKTSQKASTREPNRTEPISCSTNNLPQTETAETISDQTGLKDTSTANSDKSPGTDKPKPRERDLLFDAIAKVTASDPKVSGSHIGRVRKRLLAAEPPYTPEDVYKWFDLIRAEGWLDGYPSLGYLEQSIGKIRAAPLPEIPKRPKETGKPTHQEKMKDVWEKVKAGKNAQS